MISIFRAMAIQAFFLPRRDAIFQNFVARTVFRERVIAQAASLNAAFACVLPFTLFVLFFARTFMIARRNAGPRSKMICRWELSHIDADLCD